MAARYPTGVNTVNHGSLKNVLEKLGMKKKDVSNASDIIGKVINAIMTSDHLKNDEFFSKIEIFSSGSYYEKLKIITPNEFDIMLQISIPNYQTIELTNVFGGFYILAYRQTIPAFMAKYVDQDGNISARDILRQFRKLVSEVFRAPMPGLHVQLKKDEPSSPAVTLLIGENLGVISVDLVLALKLNQPWPDTTGEGMKIDNWLGTKVTQEYRREPFSMVPKQMTLTQEYNTASHCFRTPSGILVIFPEHLLRSPGFSVLFKDTWRISFSSIEKKIILNHGSKENCCKDGKNLCCRKPCLKLMKHLLELLKNKNKREMNQFCSYHAKTALLHMCTIYTKDDDWKLDYLDLCFHTYIEFFQTCLRNYNLPNFFIPSHNLFSSEFVDKASCDYLCAHIEYQKNHSYPLFYPEFRCPTALSK